MVYSFGLDDNTHSQFLNVTIDQNNAAMGLGGLWSMGASERHRCAHAQQ